LFSYFYLLVLFFNKRHVGRELALVLEGRWPMSCVNPAALMNNTKLRRWQPVSMERGPNS